MNLPFNQLNNKLTRSQDLNGRKGISEARGSQKSESYKLATNVFKFVKSNNLDAVNTVGKRIQ